MYNRNQNKQTTPSPNHFHLAEENTNNINKYSGDSISPNITNNGNNTTIFVQNKRTCFQIFNMVIFYFSSIVYLVLCIMKFFPLIAFPGIKLIVEFVPNVS